MSAYAPQPWNSRLDSLAFLTTPVSTVPIAMNPSGNVVDGTSIVNDAIASLIGYSAQPLLTNYNLLGAGSSANTFGGTLAIGFGSLKSATAVNDSTIMGVQANQFTVSGVGYCSFGRYASQNNLIGTNTNAFGDSAGRFAPGDQNCYFGYVTAEYHQGRYGTIMGNGSAQGGGGNGHGDFETLYGYAVFPFGPGAARNAIFGSWGKYNGRGNDDTGIGHMVLYNSTGGENTAAGIYAGSSNITGLRNTWLGESAGNDAVNQATNLIGSIGIGSRVYTTRNYQAVLGGTTVTETYLRGEVVVNGSQANLPRAQLDVVSGRPVFFGASNATVGNGMRMWSSVAGTHIESMDPTLLATYTPLNLRGSTVNLQGAATFDDSIIGTVRGAGIYADGSVRWGGSQVGNARGTLSWDTNKAIINAPHTLELSGSIGGVTANAFTVTNAISANSVGVAFNGVSAIARQSIPASPTTAQIATALSNLGLVSLT